MRLFILSIIALITISCSETITLQTSLKQYNAPIGYLHDSKVTDFIKNDSLIVRLNFYPLDSITTVSKTKGLFLPLIFFYYREVDMNILLGQKSIQQLYDEFFFNSFTDESRRTGCYAVSKLDSSDSLYTLEITIDTCITNSKYQITDAFFVSPFGYSYSYHQMGFPSETNLFVSINLTKGNKLLDQRSYSIRRTQPFLNTFNNNVNGLRASFTANMVESLSLSSKECIEAIISDVNGYFQTINKDSVKLNNKCQKDTIDEDAINN